MLPSALSRPVLEEGVCDDDHCERVLERLFDHEPSNTAARQMAVRVLVEALMGRGSLNAARMWVEDCGALSQTMWRVVALLSAASTRALDSLTTAQQCHVMCTNIMHLPLDRLARGLAPSAVDASTAEDVDIPARRWCAFRGETAPLLWHVLRDAADDRELLHRASADAARASWERSLAAALLLVEAGATLDNRVVSRGRRTTELTYAGDLGMLDAGDDAAVRFLEAVRSRVAPSAVSAAVRWVDADASARWPGARIEGPARARGRRARGGGSAPAAWMGNGGRELWAACAGSSPAGSAALDNARNRVLEMHSVLRSGADGSDVIRAATGLLHAGVAGVPIHGETPLFSLLLRVAIAERAQGDPDDPRHGDYVPLHDIIVVIGALAAAAGVHNYCSTRRLGAEFDDDSLAAVTTDATELTLFLAYRDRQIVNADVAAAVRRGLWVMPDRAESTDPDPVDMVRAALVFLREARIDARTYMHDWPEDSIMRDDSASAASDDAVSDDASLSYTSESSVLSSSSSE